MTRTQGIVTVGSVVNIVIAYWSLLSGYETAAWVLLIASVAWLTWLLTGDRGEP